MPVWSNIAPREASKKVPTVFVRKKRQRIQGKVFYHCKFVSLSVFLLHNGRKETKEAELGNIIHVRQKKGGLVGVHRKYRSTNTRSY